jgi:DNA-binding NarL/FixJ family response regulator
MKSSILIVENNAFFRKTFREVLKMYLSGLHFEEAASGEEALEQISRHTPKIVFMDIHLPGANGLELTRKIKLAHPEIIVAIFTNYDLPEYRQSALQSCADYFLIKDTLSGADIAALVKSILGGKQGIDDGMESG